MKWKCDCAYGPCAYEGANEPSSCVIRKDFRTDWKKIEEEPERKEESGLPEWLKVGNFVVFNGCNTVCRIEGYDIDKKIVAISEKSWRAARSVKRDLHCDPKGENARVVFPRPYTFETAPEIIKVRNKNHTVSDVLIIVFDPEGAGYTLVRNPNHPFISFEDVLRDYEQLDGWPCGTFDEEE